MTNRDETKGPPGLRRRTKIALVVLGILLAVSAPFVVGAITDLYTVTTGATYEAEDGPTVELAEDLDTDRQQPFPDGNTVDVRPAARFESDGPTQVRVDQFGGEWTHLSELDVEQHDLQVDRGDQTVVLGGDLTEFQFREATVDNGERDFSYSVESGGTATVDVHDLDEDTPIKAVDQDTGEILDFAVTDASGVVSLELPNADHDVELQSSDGAPILSDPSPSDGETISDVDTDLSVDVEDPDGMDSEVNVSLDGEQIHSETVSDNDTVSTDVNDLDAGMHEWTVEATDEFGQTTEDTYTFGVPDTLKLYNESDPDTLVDDNITVEVQFISDDEVVTRTTTDGEIDLTGLPVDQPLVVVAEAEGYETRQIILDSLVEQQEMFLLPEDSSNVTVLFDLQDNTGDFDSDSTRLIIKKPINKDGSTTNQIVASDTFGVSGYSVPLEEGARYQLTLQNEDGDERVLGHHTADASETIPLSVGQLEWDIGDTIGENNRLTWEAKYIEDDDENELIRFQLQDLADDTSNVEVIIHEQGDESNVIYDETHRGSFGNLTVTQPLNEDQANESWSVTWTADRDGEEIGTSTIVGEGRYPVGLPVGDNWLAMFVGGLIVFVAGFFSVGTARIGAVIVPATALGLWSLGWLPLPLTWILAALAIGVMSRMAVGGGLTQ